MKSSVFELHSGLASVPLRFTWSPFYGFTKIPECMRNTRQRLSRERWRFSTLQKYKRSYCDLMFCADPRTPDSTHPSTCRDLRRWRS